MAHTVEGEAYKAPEGYSTLAHSSNFKYDVLKPAHLNNLPQIARELGFTSVGDFPTKESQWQVFERPEHDVPNFPDGSTNISSSLAIYGTGEELTHAVLRTSPELHPRAEFERDLLSFTKHYMERPRLLGFPSQELSRVRTVFIALAAGTALMSAADYYTIHSLQGSIINVGSVLGEMCGPAAYGIYWGLSEKHARRSISHPEQYVTGERVQWTLEGERYHNVTVAIQKELYQALQQEETELTPDQFLEKIYGQIPQGLVQQRHAEIEQIKYPRLDTQEKTANSLPKLIEVSHVLQSVENYLNLANELKRGLANS
ncbi:MAG: hypothetical protein WCV81_03245 [Microgenomates group bacterium]|jgi:hypothetical protein